jgi:hypothetical protein
LTTLAYIFLSLWVTSRTMGVTPWEAGEMQPPLQEAVERSGLEFARNGRALVPDCGSVCGRAVLYFRTVGVHPNYGRDMIFYVLL